MGIDHRRHQRPGAALARGQLFANGLSNLLHFLGRRLVGPRSTQHRPRMHHQLIARQGHDSGVGTGLDRNVGHGADFAGIEPEGQEVGQVHGVGHRSARAVDPQTDEIDVPVADLFLDHVLGLADRIGPQRTLQIDADGPPTALQRGIVLDGHRRQLQGPDQLPPIGGQIPRDAQAPGLAAGELALLAGPLHHDRFLGRVLLLQLRQTLGRNELAARLGLHVEHFHGRIEHREGQQGRHGPPPVGQFGVGAPQGGRDGRLVYARRPHRGLLGHDDLLAGEGHQHGMSLDRLRQIGHGPHGVEFFAGEEVGQIVRRAEFAPPAEVLLALGHVKLEHQHQTRVFLLRLVDRPANDPPGTVEGLAGNGQRQANEAAALPGPGRRIFAQGGAPSERRQRRSQQHRQHQPRGGATGILPVPVRNIGGTPVPPNALAGVRGTRTGWQRRRHIVISATRL